MAIKSQSLGSAGSAAVTISVTGSTNATPIVITVAANSGLKTGDRLALAGITGNTAANGIWTLEAVTATTFKLLGSVGNGTHGGTVRAGLVFDKTPLMKGHTGQLLLGGNGVASLTLEAYGSYAEFAAGDNSNLGAVYAPVNGDGTGLVTNTNASSASSSTVAKSVIAIAAAQEGVPFELVMPYIIRPEITAYTSGSLFARVIA